MSYQSFARLRRFVVAEEREEGILNPTGDASSMPSRLRSLAGSTTVPQKDGMSGKLSQGCSYWFLRGTILIAILRTFVKYL